MDDRNRARTPESIPQLGMSLVEVVMASAVLAFVLIAVGVVLIRGIDQRQEAFEHYRAISTLRDFIAGVQGTANLPDNLPAQEGVAALFARYNNGVFPIANGGGEIEVIVYANEATVPAELGGVQDLNYDGDMQDNLGNQSAGTDLKVVPMEITLTYDLDGQSQSLKTYRLVTNTAN